jgi:hypothetical protein
MPRRTDATIGDEKATIAAIVAALGAPATRAEIEKALEREGHAVPDERTMRRRLEALAEEGRISETGHGRGARYASIAAATSVLAPATAAPTVNEEWLSAEGARIRSHVRQPRGNRRYVGYQRAFIDGYTPGESWYLPPSTRAHLRLTGTPMRGERPAGTFARDILARLLIDLSWASSRLEGNTYSRLDTQNLIEFGQRAEGKDAAEAQMILNHKRAIEFLVADPRRRSVDAHTVRSLHALLMAGLLRDSTDEGRLRTKPIGITGTTYIPTEDPHVVAECFDRIVEKARAIDDPFECSFFLLVQLPYLQPFIDGNKRTSRLAANHPLVDANLCPLTFLDVPEQDYIAGTLAVYELQRVDLLRDLYVWAYERSCERYVVVEQAVPRPDPLRLRYHRELDTVIAETVRSGSAPSPAAIRARAVAHGIPDADLGPFGEKAFELLLALNDASAVRAGVGPTEFFAWRNRFVAP